MLINQMGGLLSQYMYTSNNHCVDLEYLILICPLFFNKIEEKNVEFEILIVKSTRDVKHTVIYTRLEFREVQGREII